MTTRLRPLAVSAAVLVPLLFPPTLRSQDAAVDTVPAEALPADSLFADSLAPLDDPLLAGRDTTVDESTGAWLLEFPGWHGFGIEHYNRVDGLAPSWGLRFEPVDPAARPRIE